MLNVSARFSVYFFCQFHVPRLSNVEYSFPNHRSNNRKSQMVLTGALTLRTPHRYADPTHRLALLRFHGQWHAKAISDDLCCPHNSTFHQVLLLLLCKLMPLFFLDLPKRGFGDLRRQAPASFFKCLDDCVRADLQNACRITDAATVHRHINNLFFDRFLATLVSISQNKSGSWTLGIFTFVFLLTLPCLMTLLLWQSGQRTAILLI